MKPKCLCMVSRHHCHQFVLWRLYSGLPPPPPLPPSTPAAACEDTWYCTATDTSLCSVGFSARGRGGVTRER